MQTKIEELKKQILTWRPVKLEIMKSKKRKSKDRGLKMIE